MKKIINRVLRALSLKLIRAKRRKAPPVGKLVPTRQRDPNRLMTHYVGDDCPGGHRDCFKSATENTFIGPETKKCIVDPDAAFIPVDIGEDEQKAQKYDQNKNQ